MSSYSDGELGDKMLTCDDVCESHRQRARKSGVVGRMTLTRVGAAVVVRVLP